MTRPSPAPQAQPAPERGSLTLLAPSPEGAVALAGDWRLCPSGAAGERAAGLADPEFDDSGWQAVRLPHLGQATLDLDTIWYRCRFDGDALAAAAPGQATDRSVLRFGGAFYTTTAWLNGRLLGEHAGYFQPFGFDVTEALRPGSNVLVVRCRFPVEAGAFKRKTAVAGIFADWDCKPYPSTLYPDLPPPHAWWVPLGLWQPVTVRHSGPVLIEAFNIFPELDTVRWPDHPAVPGADRAVLHLSVRLRNLTAEPQDAAVQVVITPHNFRDETQSDGRWCVRLNPRESRQWQFEVELIAPRLWFPWTHGEPWLYSAGATVTVQREPSRTGRDDGRTVQVFGVRQIRADMDSGRWDWRLNGRRIFPKGSNYIAEFSLDKVTPSGLKGDLELARRANLDMLRVHAHIAPAEFYRLCDEAGLMVLCDFPLTWTYGHALPPAEDEALRASVTAQVEDMIGLLGSRPSIVLWSMHNEPPWTADGSFLGRDVHEAQTNRLMDERSAEQARALDPSRPAVAASGLYDRHLYHGWYTGSWLDNRDLTPAFPTEFGVQALPNLDSPFWTTVNAGWPPQADDPTWAHAGYQSVFWASPGVGLPSQFNSLADYVSESQAYQAFYIRHTIDQWRRRKFNPTGGYVHFLFTDGWPAITWSVLDYARLPKAGYAALAEASRPVRLCLELEDGFSVEQTFRLVYPVGSQLALKLHLVNDDYRLRGRVTVQWRLERLDGWRARLASLLPRVSAGQLSVELPSAGEGAQWVSSVRVRLPRAGQYSLRTRVSQGTRLLDENRLEFRAGEARKSGRPSRGVPRWLIGKVYQRGSLRRAGDGFAFRLRNPATPVVVQAIAISVDGSSIDPALVELVCGGAARHASTVTSHSPLDFPSGEDLTISVRGRPLAAGAHEVQIAVSLLGLGEITARFADSAA